MRKVLFISHFFPPTGGAGVQRSVKFVKYLPSLGYLPLVLTGAGRSPSKWTPEDESLTRDIPAEVPVFRAEKNAGTATNAAEVRHQALVALGSQIIEREKPGLIFVTMSPFSDARVAAELASRHGLPWVADLRDPWALDEFQVFRTGFHRWQARLRMAQALSSATSVIMNTPEATRYFRAQFPALAGKAHVSITNGFDADDFAGVTRRAHTGTFTIVHSGYFHVELGLRQQRRSLEYRILGRTEPGVAFLPRSHFYLLRALEAWNKVAPQDAKRVRVVCLGVPSAVDQALVDQSPVREIFEFTGYLPHRDCVERVRNADLLFLPMHALPAGQRARLVPGKTYEYMAAARPILAAVPAGDARDFVEASGSALVCDPVDWKAMQHLLAQQFRAWEQQRDLVQRRPGFLAQFERRQLSAQLAEEFTRIWPTQ